MFLLCSGPCTQHIVNLLTGMKIVSDSKTQAGIARGSQHRSDVGQSVVTGISPPGPESQGAERQGNIIHHHHQVFHRKF